MLRECYCNNIFSVCVALKVPADEGDPSQDANLSRSERKRNREQHRRNEVTNGLDALATMLAKIDPGRMKGGRWTSKKENGDVGVAMSRVELLNHALETLERLHTENEERKTVISSFSRCGTVASQDPSTECGLSVETNVTMTTEVSACPLHVCRHDFQLRHDQFLFKCIHFVEEKSIQGLIDPKSGIWTPRWWS